MIHVQVSEALRREKVNEENDNARKTRAEWVRLKQLEDPQLAMWGLAVVIMLINNDGLSVRDTFVLECFSWASAYGIYYHTPCVT